MEYSAPQTVPTDAEIEATLTALRIQITDKQAEISRQEGILTSNRYTIQQIANEKAEKSAQVDALTKKIADLEPVVVELETLKANIDEDIAKAKTNIASQEEEINNRVITLTAEEKIFISKLNDLEFAKEEVVKERARVDEKEKELDAIKEQLQAIINN
jgi:chromosome segregation ATPase